MKRFGVRLRRGLTLLLVVSLCLLGGTFARGEEKKAPPIAEVLGEVLPDFTVETAGGEEVVLSDLLKEKKVVLVNLFASWCGYCMREFPVFEEVYKEMGGESEGKNEDESGDESESELGIIALSLEEDDTLEVLLRIAEENELTFPLGREEGTGLLDTIEMIDIPTTIFLDPDGVIRHVQIGEVLDKEGLTEMITAIEADYAAKHPAEADKSE